MMHERTNRTNRTNDPELDKIRRISHWMAVVVAISLAGSAAAGVVFFAKWFGYFETGIGVFELPDGFFELPLGLRLIGTAMLVPAFATAVWIQVALYRLFIGFSKGGLFTVESVSGLRLVGKLLLWCAGLNFLGRLGLFAVFVYSGSLDDLSFSADVPPIGIVMGVVVLLLAWVFDAARTLAEENRLTV